MKYFVEISRSAKDERRELKGTAQWNFICGPNIPMGYSIKPYSLICVTQCILSTADDWLGTHMPS
jgi:hypothetical protein